MRHLSNLSLSETKICHNKSRLGRLIVPFLLAGLLLCIVFGLTSALVSAQGELVVSKTAWPATVKAGEPLTYTIYVTNTTGGILYVDIIDTVPDDAQVIDVGSGQLINGEMKWSGLVVPPVTTKAVTFVVEVTRAGSIINRDYRAQSGNYLGLGNPLTTTVMPGDPHSVVIAANPNPSSAGGSSVLTVEVTDAYGNTVTDGTSIAIEFDKGTIDSQPAGTTITGATSNGQVSKVLEGGTVAGTAHITATATGIPAATADVVFAPGPPYTLMVVAAPSSITANGRATATITATVTDQYGNFVTQTPVTVTTSLGKINGEGPTAVVYTNDEGRAFAALGSTVAGTATLSVTAGSLVDTSQSVHLAPGPPTHLSIQAHPTQITANGTSTSTITLLVLDENDNLVKTPVAITITTSQGTLTGGGTSYTEIATGGDMQVTLTSSPQAGTANVAATALGLNTNTSVNFAPGSPALVSLDIVPAVIPADGISTAALTATVRDTFGNPVSVPVNVTFAAAAGTLLPNSSGDTVNGIIARKLRSNTDLGSVPITATASGLSTSGTGSVDFVVGPPGIAYVSLSPTSPITVGVPTLMNLTVQDSVGHAVPGTVVTITSWLGTVTPSQSGVTDANGQLERTLVSTRAGADVIGVLGDSGPLSVNGGGVSFVPDVAVQAALVAHSAQLMADGNATTVVTATVTDQYGNPVSGVLPEFTTTIGSLSGSSTTNDSGVVTRTLQSTTELGTAIISINGLTTVMSATVDFVAGPPASAILDANPTTVEVYGLGYEPDEVTLAISVTDSVGHPIVGETLVVTSSIGTITGCGPTNAQGILNCTFYSTKSGQPQIYVAGIPVTGDVITIVPGPLNHVHVVPYDPREDPLGVKAGVPATFTALGHDFYHNLITGISFAWSISNISGKGSVDAEGVFLGTNVGLVRVKASAGGKAGVSYVQVEPGTAAMASVDADRLVLPANGTSVSNLTLRVMDAYSNVVGYGVPLTVASSIGIIEGSTSTDPNGMAYRTIRSFKAGQAVINVTNLTTVTGDTVITFTSGSPAKAIVSASPKEIPANGVARSTLRITLLDAFDNPVGAGYIPTVQASLGTISGAGGTDANGVVTRTLTAPTVEGIANFTIVYLGSPLSASGDNVTFVVGPLHHVGVNPAGPLLLPAGQPTVLNAQGYDAYNAPIPPGRVNYGWDLIFTGPGRGERSSAFGTQTVFTGTTRGAGVQLIASADEQGAFFETPVDITVLPGPIVSADITAVPAIITADGVSPITFTLANLTDAYGNTSNDGSVVTVTIQSEPQVRTNAGMVVNDQVQVVIPAATRAGTYPVSVSGSGGNVSITGDTSVTFVPGPPTQAEILSVTPPEIIADGSSTSTVVLQLRDAFQNQVAGGWTPVVSSTLGFIVPGVHATDAQGVLTRTLRAGLVVGDALVSVNGSAASGPPVSLIPGPPVLANVTVETSTLAAGGDHTSVIFDVRDAWGHSVADGTLITPTLSPNYATFSGVRQTFGGEVMQTLTSATSVGTATIGSEGQAITGDTLVTFVPGPAAVARVTAVPEMLTVGETTSLSITVTDAYSNSVPPSLISITSTLGTLDGGGSTISKTTAGSAALVTASLFSTVAGNEQLILSGPAGALTLHPSSDPILFLPDDPLSVTIDPTGPVTVTAGDILTLTASSRDGYGNAVDPWAPVDYTWWQSAAIEEPGYGTLTGADSHARAIHFTPMKAGTNRLWATGGVTPTDVLTVNVLVGPPAMSTIAINPDSVPADGVSTIAITLTGVVDALGNPVPDGTPLTVTIPSDPPVVGVGTTFGGAMTGKLSSSTAAGSYLVSVKGTGGPLTLTGTKIVSFVPGPPVRAYVDAVPETLPGDGVSTASLLVTVKDANSNRVTDGIPITVTSNLGWVTGTGVTANGTVQRTLHAPVALGTAHFTVEGPDGPLFVTGDTVKFVPGAPAAAWVTATPSRVPADGASTSQITIAIRDANGFEIEGSGIAILSVARGSIVPTTTMVSSGSLTATFSADTSVGRAGVTVVYEGRSLSTISDTLELVPGPPVSATISANPTSLRVGSIERSILTTSLFDGWGRPVANGTVVTVTTSLGDILTNSNTTTGGVITRTLAPGSRVGTANFIVSTPEGSLTPSGDTVEIMPGNLDHIEVSPSGLKQVTAGSSVLFTAVGHDMFHNETGTDLFGWTTWQGSGNGILSDEGVAHKQAIFTGTIAGTIGIQASQGTIFSPIVNVTVLPGPPITAMVSANPIAIPVGGSTSRLTITARDAFGNLVADGTPLNVTSNIGTIIGTSTTQNGTVTRTLLSGNYYGTAMFFVNDWVAGGDKVVLGPGGPARAQVTASPSSLYADGTSQTVLTIKLFDAVGMPVEDGITPVITTTLGTLTGHGATLGGVVTRTLNASRTPGVAHIYVEGFLAEGGVPFLIGPASVAHIVCDPPWLLANGASTSTLTITVQDAYGHVVTDTGSLSVSTSLGTISSFGPTVEGVTTRLLAADDEVGMAIVSVAGLSTTGDSKVPFIGASVDNGDFETGRLGNWALGSVITTASSSPAYTATLLNSDRVGSILVTPHSGASMIRLGATTSDNTKHKQGEVWLNQPIYVPAGDLTQVTFWYRLLSYDVSVGSAQNGYLEWDPFEVYIDHHEVFQDGQTFSDEWYAWYLNSPASPRDMGWKQGVIDLTPYAGQVVLLEFRLPNNRDAVDRDREVDNTWVYLDDILTLHSDSSNARVFLPLVLSGN